MDSQSVAPIAGQVPVNQVQGNAQSVQLGAHATGEAAGSVKPASTSEIQVRTRDPRTLKYQVDGETKQVVATIVDESNKVVVVQIPDAEVLRIARAIDRMKGFLLEGKA